MRCRVLFDGSISSLNCKGPVETCPEGHYCIYRYHNDQETGQKYLEKGYAFFFKLPCFSSVMLFLCFSCSDNMITKLFTVGLFSV